MEAASLRSTCPRDQIQDQEYTLREWNLKARRINRDNTIRSRRFSGSYVRSFREEEINHARSFRSNITSTISSTASSPGYNLKDEIDPSTYSFTTALRALQARSGYVWDCLSPDGLALNSKWCEAERYICNPLSGEVPMECLSSKAVSGRSNGSTLASGRVTMSAPMIYSSCNRPSVRRNINFPPKKPPPVTVKEGDDEEKENHQYKSHLYVQAEEEDEYTAGNKFKTRDIGSKTRDVGIQSTPPDYSPSSSITTCSSIHNAQESKCSFDPVERNEKDAPDSDSNPKEEVEVVKEIKELQQGANQQQITEQRQDEQQAQAQKSHYRSNINESWEIEKKTSRTTGALSRAQLCGGSRQTGRLPGSGRCGCGTALLSWKTLLWRRRSDRKPKSRTSKHFTTTIIVSDHVHHNHQLSSPSPSSSTSSSSSLYCSAGPYQRQPPKTVILN